MNCQPIGNSLKGPLGGGAASARGGSSRKIAKTEMESQIKLMDLSQDLAMTVESAEDSAEKLLKINRFS